MKQLFKNIPNILTMIRIISTPFIIYLFATGNIKVCIILIVISSITDMLDGLIARKFNLVSTFGAKLDAIADKLFGGCLVISLMLKNQLFIISLVGEIIICIINIISFIQKKNPQTTYIGKFKTIILFITIALGFLSINFHNLIIVTNIFIIISFILQIICLICYTNLFLNYQKFQKTN